MRKLKEEEECACPNCTDGSRSAPKNFQISYRWRQLSIPIHVLIHSNSAIEQFLIHCNTNYIRWNSSYKLFTKKIHFRLIVYSLPPTNFNCREALQWSPAVLNFTCFNLQIHGSHVIMKGLALIITLYSIIHNWQAHEKDLSLTNNYVTQGEISSQSMAKTDPSFP